MQLERVALGMMPYCIALVDARGWIGHTGSVPGYTAVVYYYPAIDTTVVVETTATSSVGTRGKRDFLPIGGLDR